MPTWNGPWGQQQPYKLTGSVSVMSSALVVTVRAGDVEAATLDLTNPRWKLGTAGMEGRLPQPQVSFAIG